MAELVEWFRPAPVRRLIGVAVVAVLATVAGMWMVGFAFFWHAMPDRLLPLVGGLGGALCIGGPLTIVVGFHRVLTRDDYFVAARTDGIEVRLREQAAFFAWDDLERVTEDGAAIELRRRDGATLRITEAFNGISAAEIARRLDAHRRRASFGLPLQ